MDEVKLEVDSDKDISTSEAKSGKDGKTLAFDFPETNVDLATMLE